MQRNLKKNNSKPETKCKEKKSEIKPGFIKVDLESITAYRVAFIAKMSMVIIICSAICQTFSRYNSSGKQEKI